VKIAFLLGNISRLALNGFDFPPMSVQEGFLAEGLDPLSDEFFAEGGGGIGMHGGRLYSSNSGSVNGSCSPQFFSQTLTFSPDFSAMLLRCH
jgi:hypothetical protein